MKDFMDRLESPDKAASACGKRILAVLCLALVAGSACHSQEDRTYGQSYDECILKNASRGGDEESRSTATDICARHFIRPATPFEAQESRAKAEITPAPKAAPQNLTPKAAPQNGVGGDDFYASWAALDEKLARSQGATISATLSNDDDNIIIRKVRIDAYFYSRPRRADGSFDPSSFKGRLYWDVNKEIEPGNTETVTGAFGDKSPPSLFYSADAEATAVLPHSKLARTNSLKEVP
jgi:hypothetical protein